MSVPSNAGITMRTMLLFYEYYESILQKAARLHCVQRARTADKVVKES